MVQTHTTKGKTWALHLHIGMTSNKAATLTLAAGQQDQWLLPLPERKEQGTGQLQGGHLGPASGCGGAGQAGAAQDGVPLLHSSLSRP